MKCLVTGCCGFIGSNLAKELIDEGNTVIGIDKVFSPLRLPYYKKKINISQGNVFSITNNFTYIHDDLNNISNYNFLLDDINVVYHLAAYVTIRDEDVHQNIKDTFNATIALLDLMVNQDIKNLVFSSTSSIYGDHAIDFINEEEGKLLPISHYASGKIANEAYIMSYAYHNNIKAWIFRFANVTGANQNRGVIWDLLFKLKKDPDNLFVLGNGKQRKSFFDVSDCVRGLIDIPRIDDNKYVKIYHLGNRGIIEISKLAEIVCNEAGYKPDIHYSGGDRGWKGDTPNTEISIEKALSVGWYPKYTGDEYIKRTVRWMLKNWDKINMEKKNG